MKHRIATLSLLLSLAACGSSASSGGGAPTAPAAAAPDPWAELREWGDLDGARTIFEAYQQGDRAAEGTVGLMTLATIEGDSGRLAGLVESLDVDALESPELLAQAAVTAFFARPVLPIALALGQRACALADAEPDSPDVRRKAREACAEARVAAAAGALDVCTAGCDGTHELPILLAGNSPVVRATVSGSQPTPFIIDTGASTSVVTRAFAEANGIEPIEGTTYSVGSPGGMLEVDMALVDVQVGELRIEKVPVIIVELPIEFVGGIISPQATFHGLVTELDFRSLTLRVGARASDPAGMAELPLRFSEHNPYLQAAIGGRRPVPFLLDTGATQTSLFTSWEALDGEPIQRGPETRLAGAGGVGARAWVIPAALQATAGPLEWKVIQPLVAERGDGEALHGEVRYRGLVGMDLMMGRRVQLDLPDRKLRISSEQRLGAWPDGATATYRIQASGWAQDIVLTERVLERRTDPSGLAVVVVDVTYTGEQEGHFRYAMPDLWQTRGTWLVARPALMMWDVADDGTLSPVAPADRAERWLPAFVPFQPQPAGNPNIRFLPLEREGAEPLSCTEIALPAAAQASAEATLEVLECPAEPWRTRRLTLRGPDGAVIYQFEIES